MDRPTVTETPALTPLARVLAEGERLREFAERRRARRAVSEPILPLFLAALHRARGGPLVCVLPDDARGARRRRGSGWFLGEERVGLFASRGVRWGSGLEPPPHLVGERARALDVLAAGGLVCASALGLGRGHPAGGSRPSRSSLRAGDEPGVEGLAERSRSPATSVSTRSRSAGQFAVRGGLVDVFPSTGREPVRVELFGDEIESLRAFSPFTQRTLHALDEATVYPAAERRPDLASRRSSTEAGEAPPVPADLVPPLPAPRPRLAGRRGARRSVREELGADDSRSTARCRARPAPARASRSPSRPSGPRSPRAACRRPRTTCWRFVRGGNRVVVTFAHRGEALRTKAMLRRVEAVAARAGRALPEEPGLVFAVSPARRGFVSRDLGIVLLPDTQVFRKRPPRADARRRARAPELRRPAHRRLRRPRGPRRRAAARLRDEDRRGRHARLPLPGFPRRRPPLRPARADRQGLPLRGRGRPCAGALEARRQGVAERSRPARARVRSELAGELLALYAQRQRAEGIAYDADDELVEQLEASFPFEETPDQRAPSRRSRKISRRRGRWTASSRRRRLREDGGRRARRLRGGRQRQAGARARADDDARAAALEHVPRPLSRPARPRRAGLTVPQAGRGEARPRGVHGRARSTSSSGRTACSRATSCPRISAS